MPFTIQTHPAVTHIDSAVVTRLIFGSRNTWECENSMQTLRRSGEGGLTLTPSSLSGELAIVTYGCISLGESKNGFVIPDHMDSSTPKKRKIQKRIILS